MTSGPMLQPLFVGAAELVIVGIVGIVIIYGDRAPSIANRVGESFAEFQKSKRHVEEEVEDVTQDLDDVRQEVQDVTDVNIDGEVPSPSTDDGNEGGAGTGEDGTSENVEGEMEWVEFDNEERSGQATSSSSDPNA